MAKIDKITVDNTEYDIVSGDNLPVGTEVEVEDGTTIPTGWEEVEDKEADCVISVSTVNSWKIVKWNSGRVECYGTITLPTISVAGSQTISLPIQLVNTNYNVNYNLGIGNGWADWVFALVGKNLQSLDFYYVKKGSENLVNCEMEIYLNGSWK